jgi:Flp pilus assembly protein TadG
VPRSTRLRSQDGFIREIVWIVVILAIIAVVILDGMAIFNAYQSAGNGSADAAQAALTEYAQTTNVQAAELAAQAHASKKGIEIVKFSVGKTPEGSFTVSVTGKTSAETYAFRYLGWIPPLKDWVERTTHPVRTNSAE